MEVLRIIVTIIHLLSVVALIAIVMLQTGKNGLSGAITGSSESFMSKNKNASKEARLARFTAIIGAVFMVLTFVLNMPFFN